MASSTVPTMKTLISEASQALKLLNGAVCLYKPLGYGINRTMKEFKFKILEDLNNMKPPPRKEIVEVRRVNMNEEERRFPLEGETVLTRIPDGPGKQIEITKGLSYTDHPLVIGRRYIEKDIKMLGSAATSSEISGVHVYGVGTRGVTIARNIYSSRWVRTYLVSGRLGVATDNCFHTGRIIEKATYGSVRPHMLEKYLLSIQASHQRMAFQASGAPINSDRAYELASQGLVRPDSHSHPIVYALKLTDFQPPDFTVEMKVVNEEFQYLKQLIHDIALKIHSTAHCTKIQCTNVGPFTVEDALLHKHWNTEHVLSNMQLVRNRLKDFDLTQRDPWVTESVDNTKENTLNHNSQRFK